MPKENNKKTEVKNKTSEISKREDRPIRDIFNRFFDQELLDPFDFWRRAPQVMLELRRNVFPKIDIDETDKEVKVVADIPGVNPDNIDIDVQENQMTLRGTIEQKNAPEGRSRPYRYERTYGEFFRQFTLPTRVKRDEVRALYKDGVLTVILPKSEMEKGGKIKIEKQ